MKSREIIKLEDISFIAKTFQLIVKFIVERRIKKHFLLEWLFQLYFSKVKTIGLETTNTWFTFWPWVLLLTLEAKSILTSSHDSLNQVLWDSHQNLIHLRMKMILEKSWEGVGEPFENASIPRSRCPGWLSQREKFNQSI